MNLVERPSQECKLANFRREQYSYIDEYINNLIDYSLFHGFISDGTRSIEVIPSMTYQYYEYNAFEIYKLQINKVVSSTDRYFLRVAMPKLVDDTFFVINDVKYIPAIYITDAPITIKKSSVMLQSCFCPITIFHRNKRVILLQHNIALDSFLQLLFDADRGEQTFYDLGVTTTFRQQTNEHIYTYFSELFRCGASKEEIIAKLDSLFFDNWTSELYRKFYGLEKPSLVEVVELAIDKVHEERHFTDLNNKRLVFLEPLFRPLAKTVSYCVKQILMNQEKISYLNLNEDCIIDNFIKNLNMNFLYDTVNGYTSILAHKGSFKNPFNSSGVLPKTVSSIHPSHKGRVCPVSIGTTSPGETVSFISVQDIDYKFGIWS